MANNVELYDAAFAGALGASQFSGKNPGSSTSADYLVATQRAEAFALKVDSLIATATITTAQRLLMLALCQAAWDGRGLPSATQADYASIAAEIAAAYAEGILKLL